MQLQPSLMVEKEIYIIESSNTKLYLEWYLNTNYGCEYTLYAGDFAELEGGVIDDVDYEDEETVLNLIVTLLEDLCVCGNRIMKMVESEIPMFEERTELKWREKVATFKRD
jgi:hypothetical protein